MCVKKGAFWAACPHTIIFTKYRLPQGIAVTTQVLGVHMDDFDG